MPRMTTGKDRRDSEGFYVPGPPRVPRGTDSSVEQWGTDSRKGGMSESPANLDTMFHGERSRGAESGPSRRR